MQWSLVGIAAVLALWALFADRLNRWQVTPALVLVVAGALVGFGTHDDLANRLDTEAVQPVIEMILAFVLFGHATHVRNGFFGGHTRLAMRLLLIAMPISVVAAFGLGWALLPGLEWAALLAIACVVVPVDFAPVTALLHDSRLPARVRDLLNVEEGYTDGVLAPVFAFALLVAGGEHTKAESVTQTVGHGIPQLAVAIVLGLGIGAGVALLANAAQDRHLMTEQSMRVIVVCVPVLTYLINIGLHGNGFIATFLCGIAFNNLRRYRDAPRELGLSDDLTFLLGAVVWFVFGATAWAVLEDGVSPGLVLFCVLVLTVVRFGSVLLAMLGSGLPTVERNLVAGLGPRGTATIVFGLLAYNVLSDRAETTVLSATILVVLGSVVLHGIAGPALAGRHARGEAAPATE